MSALSSSTEKPDSPLFCTQPKAIKRHNDGLFVQKREPDLYFVMERICDENIRFWARFSRQEMKKSGKLYHKSGDITSKYLVTGAMGFRDSLVHYAIYRDMSPHELWILYASVKTVKVEIPCAIENLEMTCTISTSSKAPFVTHMGISRTVLFAARKIDNLKHHSNISFDLHSFGASVMKLQYPEKTYMITTPMSKMLKIFIHHLGEQNVHIGFDEGWSKDIQQDSEECDTLNVEIERVETLLLDEPQNEKLIDLLNIFRKQHSSASKHIEFYSKKVASRQPEQLLTIETEGTAFISFKLKDRAGKIILDLDRDGIDEYRWYFKKDTTFSSWNSIIAIALDILTQRSLPSPSIGDQGRS